MLPPFLHVLLLNKLQVGCCAQLTHQHDGKHAAVIHVGLKWVLQVTATTFVWLFKRKRKKARKNRTSGLIHAADVAYYCNIANFVER